MTFLVRLALVLPGLLVVRAAGAQTMSVTAASVDLPSPDTTAYDAGVTPAVQFSVMVTGCTGLSGCRVTVENPEFASPVPIALEWRLVVVGQTGEGALGCEAQVALHVWQPLQAIPTAIMDTGAITEPGTQCVAGLEVRAAGLSYSQHQYTSPPTTYWREALLRTVEK